jgi:zinc protease
MFRKINILLCLLLFGVMLFAQQSGLDRSKSPKAEKPKEVSFPKFKEAVLSNGLGVIVVENHDQPVVFVSITTRGGSYFDDQKPGLSSLVSELLIKGTGKRNAMQIAQEIDFLGAELNSSSSWDANKVSIKLLKKNIDKGLDIFSDCIINPSFPEEELSREINQRMAELKHSKSEPNYLAEINFSKVLYGNLPYSKPVSGDENSLKTIMSDDLKKFFSKYFLPGNSFCVVTGDITLNEAVSLLESKLSGWKKGEEVRSVYKKFEINNQKKIVVVDKKDAVQSSIRIGCIALDRNNPDFFAAYVLNTYLGGYFRSQLNLNLREKNSYTYGASSGFDARMLPGPFSVKTQVASAVTTQAVTEIFNEIDALVKKTIPDERLTEVKNFIIGSFPVGIQTNSQVAGAISNIKLFGLPLNYYDNYVSSIQKITKADVVKAAKKYLDSSKLSIVISGDSKSITEGLKKFGSVEVVDAEGNPLK